MSTAIDEAIKFELEGVTLYTDLQTKAQDILTKKLFESLVAQEKMHLEYITNFSQSRKFEPLRYNPLENSIQKVFESISQESAKKEKISQAEGYELALKLEDKGYHLYQKALAEASEEEDKKFFKFLSQMEQEHYEALANVYYYLTENDKWLAENESITWSWMNL
ncbi:MAG: ferritin family protein [Candidatus Margulisbacteria bacterium]|nr:ferritin family protein [Candidatus Margulisiibacteriota bacterium]